MNLYCDPDKFGLESVGEIEWSSGSYEFDLTVVWRRTFDGRFVYGEDSGCSCPSPFEDQGVEDLKLVKSLAEFQQYLNQQNVENTWYGGRSQEIAELLERMHKAGQR